MSPPRKPRPKPLCSSVDCPNEATLQVQRRGVWHNVCRSCWEVAKDQQDGLIPKPPAASDRKRASAGDFE